MITRKTFIQSAGALTVAATGNGLFGRGIKFLFADTAGYINKKLTPVEIEILKYAALAPSGHNAQPWQLKFINQGHWELGISPERKLPAVDPDNREAKLSLGAFLMNLETAAAVYGYNTEFNFTGKGSHLADIFLRPANTISDCKMLSLIEKRYTHRGAMARKEFTNAAVQNLAGKNRMLHYFPCNSVEGKVISEGTIEANRAQAMRRDAMLELSRWIRWSDFEARKFMNGITPESMGISGFPLWFVKNFYGPADVLKHGFIEKTVESAAEAVKNCGGWIIITSDKTDNSSLIKTGIFFEDLFLKSRSMEIGFHPMTQILEEEGFRENINSQLGIKEKIQFIIRTGFTAEFPSYRKLRMNPESFII